MIRLPFPASVSKSLALIALCCFSLSNLATPAQAQSSQPLVDRIEIDDTIQPVTAERLDRALAAASQDHAAALLIDLDTPGGLLDSTRHMVGAMLSSPVPVIVYIAPAGARGGSAGFFILEAADIAAMAPGTNAGASHPVLESGTPDDTMKQKMENDAAAFLRSYVVRRGRNPQLAEQAVRASQAFSADEAQNQHLIDLIAPSDAALIAALDGHSITRIGNSAVNNGPSAASIQTLHLANARIVTLEPTTRERLLDILANPNFALLFLVGGGMLIYAEFNIPGTIVPGALGTVMVLLAIFALNMLPLRGTAILLLVAAVVLMLLELKFASHGILAAAGIVCLILGTLTLVDSPIPELAIQPAIAIALSAGFGLITFFLLRLALRARRNKALMGAAALVGAAATAMEPLGTSIPRFLHSGTPGLDDLTVLPVGRVLVQGEIWHATSTEPVAAETRLVVTGHHGDILEVEPRSPAAALTS